MARQRQAIVSGLRESVLTFERDVKDISSRDVIEVMMMTQCAFILDSAYPDLVMLSYLQHAHNSIQQRTGLSLYALML